jgi:cation diffusion facilitator CzcD-associated flavoprotein CzcO
MTIAAPAVKLTADVMLDRWLDRFGQAMGALDHRGAASCITEDGFWKDALAFTWSYRTAAGREAIEAAMAERLSTFAPRDFRISAHHGAPAFLDRFGMTVVEGYFDFDTEVGTCTGFVRLAADQDDPDLPVAMLVLTSLRQLRGIQESLGARRPSGLEYSYTFAGDNWLDQRIKRGGYRDRDPEVVIVGGGQSGLALAAVCGQMGLDTLIAEKNARIGDNWRNRYHSLTLHNEIYSNDLPYLPFPPTWPTFVPKDKLANWLESYAEAMELNVWTGAEVLSGRYDDADLRWTLQVRQADGTTRAVRAQHVVMAGGSASSAPNIPTMPGLAEFLGEVIHSHAYDDGRNHAGKRVLVVGTGNSGHDVAQDLHANGAAAVTMMQRRPTYVLSLVPGAVALYAPYAQGQPVEDVDLVWAASPYPLMVAAAQMVTRFTAEQDKELLDGLHGIGFETDDEPDHTGLHMKYLRHGGRYYINVGCSELLIDGSIKLVQHREIDRFVAEGLRMDDGTVLGFDMVVMATGYLNQQEGIRRLFGDEIADRVGPIWGLDDDGEIRGLWKQTGQPGMWVVGGNLLDVRLKSRWTALQLKAAVEGILPTVVHG